MNDRNDTHEEQEIITDSNESPIADIEVEEEEELSKVAIKNLRDKFKASEKERAELLEELQRTKADFLNSKRRIEEQAKTDGERKTEKMLIEMLPLADSFDMAMSDTENWEKCDENWRKGVEGIHAQLQSILKRHDVTTYGAIGESFDPEEHEALGTADVDGRESDTVIEVIQKGYKRGETILRPAKVILQN